MGFKIENIFTVIQRGKATRPPKKWRGAYWTLFRWHNI